MSKIFTKPFRPLDWVASPHDFTGDNQLGIYTNETTQRYVYGTRYITWDGRVFKYYNAAATCYSYHGAFATEGAAVSWHTGTVAGYAGDRHISPTVTGRSEDDLAGGYAMVHDATATDQVLLYGIVGNDASGATTTKTYLEASIPFDIASGSENFVLWENPYRNLTEVSQNYGTIMGVPRVNTTVGQKGWLQTWGPCLCSGAEDLGSPDITTRSLTWGNVNACLTKDATDEDAQYAGYILVGSASAEGPLFMLMCST